MTNGVIKLSYCASENQTADFITTKPLKLEQFEELPKMLGVIDITKVS